MVPTLIGVYRLAVRAVHLRSLGTSHRYCPYTNAGDCHTFHLLTRLRTHIVASHYCMEIDNRDPYHKSDPGTTKASKRDPGSLTKTEAQRESLIMAACIHARNSVSGRADKRGQFDLRAFLNAFFKRPNCATNLDAAADLVRSDKT